MKPMNNTISCTKKARRKSKDRNGQIWGPVRWQALAKEKPWFHPPATHRVPPSQG